MPQVVLPVLNEAQALPWVLHRMPDGYEPIVVDNGSTDGSGDVAGRLGAVVVRQPIPGFGAACHAGLVAAGDGVVCFMDADASLDPQDLPSVADPVAAGDADLVLGERRPDRGAWPWHARLANRALALELRRTTGMRLRDIGPMRAALRSPLMELGIQDRRFGWPLEMVVRALERGWTLREVPVRYSVRVGKSKVSASPRGAALAVRDMARVLR